MRLSTIVRRELWRRKRSLYAGLAGIGLAVAGFVCVTATSASWARAIETQLQSIGPNAFLVPRGTSMTAFHRSDFSMPQMPEYYLAKLRRSGTLKQAQVAPALLFTTRLKGRKVVLRGWSQEAQLPGAAQMPPFASDEIVLGPEAAERLDLRPGDVLEIRGRSFRVRAVRPKLGAMSDLQVICDLRELQRMLGVQSKFTMLELIVTEQGGIDSLARELPTLLPDVRLITRRAIIKTQLDTLVTVRRYSFLLVGLIALAAAVGIALQTVTDVRHRRREIGTLMAVGASTRQILGMFVHKAVLIGMVGGASGYLVGAAVAALLGPRMTGLSVRPSFGLLLSSVIAGVLLSSLAAAVPAFSAARLNPAEALTEK
jgi:putative ABC transport system permease protein